MVTPDTTPSSARVAAPGAPDAFISVSSDRLSWILRSSAARRLRFSVKLRALIHHL